MVSVCAQESEDLYSSENDVTTQSTSNGFEVSVAVVEQTPDDDNHITVNGNVSIGISAESPKTILVGNVSTSGDGSNGIAAKDGSKITVINDGEVTRDMHNTSSETVR